MTRFRGLRTGALEMLGDLNDAWNVDDMLWFGN